MHRTSLDVPRTVLAATAVALIAPAGASAQERVHWQAPMSFASDLTALGDTLPWVADQLRVASGGNIDLRIAEPGVVVPALSIFENVSSGAIEAGYSWMGYEIAMVPASALFGATPFGLESTDYLAWMNFHGGRELLNEIYASRNVFRSPAARYRRRRPAGSGPKSPHPRISTA